MIEDQTATLINGVYKMVEERHGMCFCVVMKQNNIGLLVPELDNYNKAETSPFSIQDIIQMVMNAEKG